jgi:sugar-specific transcriptional regulator TrmB
MKEIVKILNNIGLNRNQAKTYLTMLKLGKSSIIDIANESKISRTTLYDNIRKLEELDLVSEFWERGKKYFAAETPENILKVLEGKRKTVENILPDLLKTFKVSKLNPRITIMNGKKGLVKMHKLSLVYNKKRLTRYLGEVESLFSYLPEKFIKNYIANRVKKGIHNQVITTKKILARKKLYSTRRNKECLRKVRYLDNINAIDTAFFNFDDKVFLISSSKEGFVVMIESQEFAKTFNSIFEFLWEVGKEI